MKKCAAASRAGCRSIPARTTRPASRNRSKMDGNETDRSAREGENTTTLSAGRRMKDLLGLEQIYVVNPRSSEARRRSITAGLASFGLEAEFVHEWDQEDITEEVRRQTFTGDVNIRQQSCGLKHITALRSIVARGQRRALILEDDALFAPGFAEGVRA